MERYIIPFEFREKPHYVFIDKDESRRAYEIVRIMPATEEPYVRSISFESLDAIQAPGMKSESLQSTVVNTLYKFLAARGWLSMSN